jgi:hypothetical protein
MRRLGIAVALALCCLPATGLAGHLEPPRVDAVVVPPEFREAIAALRTHTALPIVVPADMSWAQTKDPLIACFGNGQSDSFDYFIVRRASSPNCWNDPMFFYATVDAARWSGPFESFGRRVDLGRGVDGEVSFATGFDDPGLPRSDSLAFHIGATRYDVQVRWGDIVALARSIVANARLSGPQHLRVASPIAPVVARHIEPGIAEGVAILRRLTWTPIFVPRAPAIDSSIQLFPQEHGGRPAAGYTYFLCRSVACTPDDTVAQVDASPTYGGPSIQPAQNVDLACGVRGSFVRIDERTDFAQLYWHDRKVYFSIISAKNNPSHTDVVRLARSMVANSCS